MSIAGGLKKSIERGIAIGCNTMQIFTKNNKAWFGKKITDEEANIFKTTFKKSGMGKFLAHTSYLINLASSNSEVEQKSKTALLHELQRCEQLNIPYLVLHPGSHTGQGEENGISQISKNLDSILEKATGKTKILLENMAGQGTNLGYTFEQLRDIYKKCKYKKLLAFCFDTCHAYSAGYDIGTKDGYKKTWEQIDRLLGHSRIKAIHINDSKTELGSHKDRHASIGEGKMPLKTFTMLMQDESLRGIPMVLETPDPEKYKSEIKTLRKMALSKNNSQPNNSKKK